MPTAVGAVIALWIGSVGAGLGLTAIDARGLLRFAPLGMMLVAVINAAERSIRDHLALHAPEMVGLGRQILLGTRRGVWVTAPPQVATLVIGPPRSGKTSGVIIPNIMAWSGPVLATSTRRDVLDACAGVRAPRGEVWCFEPLESTRGLPDGVRRLDWSPLRGCEVWDVALQRARALMAGASKGAENADHWRSRGTQMLAALLHAAVLDGRPMSVVCEWVHGNRLEPAQHMLGKAGSVASQNVLDGVGATPGRERGSIWSAVAGALTAFDSAAVLAGADRAGLGEFNASTFLEGDNSVFVVAPADQAVGLAPLVVGLVEEVRVAALRSSDVHGALERPLLLALDEVANISPLPSLPQIASEGGGRNIVLLAAVQDLSQVRERWSADVASGLLTLAGAKLVLPALGDTDTLERIEKLCGKAWVVHESVTSGSALSRTSNWSRHRGLVEEAAHPAASIRALQPGTGLAVVGGAQPVVVDLAMHYAVDPFRTWSKSATDITEGGKR
jgi:type IV secretory pathway TraG/TraD family ATPase VirD4